MGKTVGRLKVALVCTGVRVEEKWLIRAFDERGVQVQVVNDRAVAGRLDRLPVQVARADAVVMRAKSMWRGAAFARWFEAHGATVLNPAHVIETCGDKTRTSIALVRAQVPTLLTAICGSPEAGELAAQAVGYPLVVKPTIGSWGRLVGRVNDGFALETVLEHKESIGGAPHAVSYLQEWSGSGGRDIRAFVIGGDCVAAIERRSSQWRANTALGAEAAALGVTRDLADVACAAAAAVGGGILAIDLFEHEGAYVVNEVNATIEFRNSVAPTGVDIPGHYADHVVQAARAA